MFLGEKNKSVAEVIYQYLYLDIDTLQYHYGYSTTQYYSHMTQNYEYYGLQFFKDLNNKYDINDKGKKNEF